MVVVSDTVEVAVSAERAFDVFVDPRIETKYNPMLLSARKMDDGPIVKGSRFECEHKKMGHMTIDISAYEAGRSFEMTMTGRMGSGTFTARLTPHGSTTRIDEEMTLQPKGFMKVMAFMAKPMMQKEMRATNAHFKEYIESGPVAGSATGS